MNDPVQILKKAKSILLVDWPDPGLPRILLQAGFTVFGYSPSKYTCAEILPGAPTDVDVKNIFPPGKQGEESWLVFRPIPGKPPVVDIIYVYRPEEELAGIIKDHALPLGAESVWCDPPGMSETAGIQIANAGLIFIGNVSIAETAKQIVP